LSEQLTVSVPGSSANLGPGFDTLAAALDRRLRLVVRPAPEFKLVTDLDLPKDRSNLLVRAFERVLPADNFAFEVDSDIPLCGGLGSSASAVVAGVLAAQALGGECPDPLALAIEVDGVPDNSTAAMHGGITITVGGVVSRINPPASVELVVVAPTDSVHTNDARRALPATVDLAAASSNAGYAAALGAGLASDDVELIAHGLHDTLHQQARASLFPRSADLLERATELGAIGATISGAGPAVLFWCLAGSRAEVVDSLSAETSGWATVFEVGFDDLGATVEREAIG